MQTQACLFCGHRVSLVHVHGHYQCPVCKTNALPCCDGDNCETNLFLSKMETRSQTEVSPQEKRNGPAAAHVKPGI